ncbi:MAG: hypothetical protein D6798_16685 [Deltaproteobacteria bacterium]|nr:MAG: hypothetical protein D6798_16685 [Deltaproteobacteria bacterium]
MLSLLAMVAASHPAYAWGHHYLVSHRALEHEGITWADTPVVVESVDSLLAADSAALSEAIDAHYAWLLARGSDRFHRQVLPREGATRADLIRACRLHPGVHLPLVLRVLPGGERHGFPVAPEAASPYLHAVGPLLADVEVTREGSMVPAGAVFATFTDEPDWGFDHELWGYTEYGYGPQPFGKPRGESSKAPFHMQFDHENLLTRALTDLDEAMVPERIDLFLRLSEAAFSTDHDYWGLRFAAWAAHYAEDLAQPYHSRAVPSARLPWYLHYMVSGDKETIEAETTQLSANRHFLYEDFVAYGLQQSYVEDTAAVATLASFLRTGPATLNYRGSPLGPDATAQQIVDALTGPAARHAPIIDETLRTSFPPSMTEDPQFDYEQAQVDIRQVLAQVSPTAQEALLAETGKDFAQAGAAARTVLVVVGAEARLAD